MGGTSGGERSRLREREHVLPESVDLAWKKTSNTSKYVNCQG